MNLNIQLKEHARFVDGFAPLRPTDRRARTTALRRRASYEGLPLLRYLAQHPDVGRRQPMAGVRILTMLHLFPNAVGAVQVLIDCGADPANIHFYYKPYPYPGGAEIRLRLQQLGVAVKPKAEFTENELDQIEALLAEHEQRLLVFEDGGMIAPRVHRRRSLLTRTLGFCEQTTKGVSRMKEVTRKPQRPYLALPLSQLKREFEPPHVARAFVKTLDACLPGFVSRKRVAILGCGCIGRHVARELRDLTPHVTVYDPKLPLLFRLLNEDFIVAKDALEAVREADIVVGCSGTLTIDAEVIAHLKPGATIVSASSDQEEIGRPALDRTAVAKEPYRPHAHPFASRGELGTSYRLLPDERSITLLADGFPLNFLGFADTDRRPFDLIMAVFTAGALALANGDIRAQRGFCDVFDVIDAQFGLSAAYLRFDRHHR